MEVLNSYCLIKFYVVALRRLEIFTTRLIDIQDSDIQVFVCYSTKDTLLRIDILIKLQLKIRFTRYVKMISSFELFINIFGIS